MLLKDLSLGVIANDSGIDKAAEIELLRSELRHDERGYEALLLMRSRLFCTSS